MHIIYIIKRITTKICELPHQKDKGQLPAKNIVIMLMLAEISPLISIFTGRGSTADRSTHTQIYVQIK